jgi:hypothetical protein
MSNRQAGWLLSIACLFKTCAKFVEVIDAMLDADFQPRVGAINFVASRPLMKP